MNCPKCNARATVKNCVETRENEMYRKRVCDQCGHTFYTVEYEVVENARFKKEWKHYNNQRRKSYDDKSEKKTCSSYHLKTKRVFDARTRESAEYKVGVCYGTREQDECKCGGDRSKCDFYPENRK